MKRVLIQNLKPHKWHKIIAVYNYNLSNALRILNIPNKTSLYLDKSNLIGFWKIKE